MQVDDRVLEAAVLRRLQVLHKSPLLATLTIMVPVLTTITSLIGGLFTVYASTDCKSSKFGTYSRGLLYTSLSYALVRTVSGVLVNNNLQFLIRHPQLATVVFVGQVAVATCFFITMLVLLTLVFHSACPAARTKVEARLFH